MRRSGVPAASYPMMRSNKGEADKGILAASYPAMRPEGDDVAAVGGPGDVVPCDGDLRARALRRPGVVPRVEIRGRRRRDRGDSGGILPHNMIEG